MFAYLGRRQSSDIEMMNQTVQNPALPDNPDDRQTQRAGLLRYAVYMHHVFQHLVDTLSTLREVYKNAGVTVASQASDIDDDTISLGSTIEQQLQSAESLLRMMEDRMQQFKIWELEATCSLQPCSQSASTCQGLVHCSFNEPR